MAKSSMMMDTAEIASMEAEMSPDMGEPVGGGAGSTDNPADAPRESRSRKAKPEPDLEFVAEPEEEGGDSDETAAPEKTDAKAKDEKAAKAETESNQAKALSEERARRREIQKALETERIQNAAARAALETKVNMINEAIARNNQARQQQPQVDQDPLPPPDDVIGRQEWLIRQNQRQAQHQQAVARQQWEAQQRQAANQAQSQQEQQILAETRATFSAAVREEPATWDAYQYVQGARIRQLRAFGTPEHQIRAALELEEKNAIHFARSQGKSYHEVIRTFADTMGWVPPNVRQQQAAQQAPRDANGRFAPNGNGQSEDNAGKLERLAKTVDASDTLSNSGGSPGGNTRISLDSIDKMSPSELQALVRKLEKGGPGGVDKALAKMMGM